MRDGFGFEDSRIQNMDFRTMNDRKGCEMLEFAGYL